MNKLETDSVHLSFDGRKILSNVYLKCQTGDVVGVIGRNGSGKSCLMKIIFGSLQGENQSVRVNGVYHKQLYRIPKAIHFMPQEGLFMDYLTFKQLINIFRLEYKLDQLMEIEELHVNFDTKIGELSGGVKKLIEIMSLLYTDSMFTLLDEPFSHLSPVLVEKIAPHIERQSKVKGIILTDHQYQTVWSIANKYYILYESNLKQIYEFNELERYGYLMEKGTI